MENTVKYRKFILPIVVGLLIWALTPFKPDAVDPTAWYMFSNIRRDNHCLYYTTDANWGRLYNWIYNHGTRWHC